ncbi:hypothetical protein IE4803_CH03482 [Rhizobium etli bv. phaseoli str. IE4803]|nr:hypothetical protein IE4803_CH03482 [Rhizobium etli bv. phaseoli str. IE4803]
MLFLPAHPADLKIPTASGAGKLGLRRNFPVPYHRLAGSVPSPVKRYSDIYHSID